MDHHAMIERLRNCIGLGQIAGRKELCRTEIGPPGVVGSTWGGQGDLRIVQSFAELAD
jgi:hypothetical protein